MVRSTLFAFAFLAQSAFAVPADIAASLSIAPEHVLPGVPARVRLTVTNVSSMAVAWPRAFAVVVQRGTEAPFLLDHFSGFTALLPDADIDTFAHAATRIVDLPFEPRLMVANLTTDPRFRNPGEYRLSFLLFDDLQFGSNDSTWAGVPPTIEQALERSVARSNEATLRVISPGDEDAVVWREISARTRSGADLVSPRGNLLVKELVDRYPHSAYTPYLAIWYPATNEMQRIRVLNDGIAASDDAVTRDLLLVSLAEAHEKAAYATYYGDLPAAIAHADAAHAILDKLAAHPSSPELGATAVARMQKLPTRELLVTMHDEDIRRVR